MVKIRWDLVILVFTIIGGIGGALYIGVYVSDSLASSPTATRTLAAALGAGAVAGLVWAAGTVVARWIDARRRAARATVPAALISEWVDVVIRIQQVYGRGSNHQSSFTIAGLSVTNELHVRMPTSPVIRVAEQMYTDFQQDQTDDAVLAWSRGFLEDRGGVDGRLFNAFSQMARDVFRGAARHADNFGLVARQTINGAFSKSVQDQWEVFQKASDALAETFEALDRKTRQLIGGQTSYIPRIRRL